MSEHVSNNNVLNKIKQQWHGTLKSYLIGFVLSLILTLISFYLVLEANLVVRNKIIAVIALAIIQASVQLFFFLHVGQDKNARSEAFSLYFTIFILLVIVLGSIWVMTDLNERMMPGM